MKQGSFLEIVIQYIKQYDPKEYIFKMRRLNKKTQAMTF